jgi:hypothetical protein
MSRASDKIYEFACCLLATCFVGSEAADSGAGAVAGNEASDAAAFPEMVDGFEGIERGGRGRF